MREWRRGEGERGKQDSLREGREKEEEKKGQGERGRKVSMSEKKYSNKKST